MIEDIFNQIKSQKFKTIFKLTNSPMKRTHHVKILEPQQKKLKAQLK
jgi:hypothetical protein